MSILHEFDVLKFRLYYERKKYEWVGILKTYL